MKPTLLAALLATLLTPDLRIHLARADMWLKHHDAAKAREEYAIVAKTGNKRAQWGMAETYDLAKLITYGADVWLADEAQAQAWYKEAMKR